MAAPNGMKWASTPFALRRTYGVNAPARARAVQLFTGSMRLAVAMQSSARDAQVASWGILPLEGFDLDSKVLCRHLCVSGRKSFTAVGPAPTAGACAPKPCQVPFYDKLELPGLPPRTE